MSCSSAILSVAAATSTLTLAEVSAVLECVKVIIAFGSKTWGAHATGGANVSTYAEFATTGSDPTTWAELAS